MSKVLCSRWFAHVCAIVDPWAICTWRFACLMAFWSVQHRARGPQANLNLRSFLLVHFVQTWCSGVPDKNCAVARTALQKRWDSGQQRQKITATYQELAHWILYLHTVHRFVPCLTFSSNIRILASMESMGLYVHLLSYLSSRFALCTWCSFLKCFLAVSHSF